MSRLKFAIRYAAGHLLISATIAVLAAVWVFSVLYAWPWRAVLGVGAIFALLLAVDVVCGPLLTLILSNPRKSRHERWIDFSLIGAIQLAALIYGLHSVWVARPVVLAFEVDRLVVVTANEVQTDELAQALPAWQHLPTTGVWQLAVRPPQGTQEANDSLAMEMAGIAPSMRPSRWQPWAESKDEIRRRAKPLPLLLEKHPQERAALQAAADRAAAAPDRLTYLPLVSSKTMDWVALLDAELNIVGYAPVEGF